LIALIIGPLPNVFNIKEKTHAVLAIKAEKKNDRREEGV
jgi:hypothetical protein